jgi:hypothetical protein
VGRFEEECWGGEFGGLRREELREELREREREREREG